MFFLQTKAHAYLSIFMWNKIPVGSLIFFPHGALNINFDFPPGLYRALHTQSIHSTTRLYLQLIIFLK